MKYILYTILTVISTQAMAQATYKLSVGQLFELGLSNSITIQADIVKEQLADDRRSLARNKRLPDITLGGVLGYVGTPVIMDTDLSFRSHANTPDWKQNYQASATQPLYQGGRIKYGIEKAEIESRIAQLSIGKDKSDLKLWLIAKYLDLFNLYKKREVYNQNIAEAKIRVHDIEKMRQQGMITTNDVLRSKLLLTNYQLAAKETNNDIALVSQQLTIALGMDENLIIEPDEEVLSSTLAIKSEPEYVDEAYSLSPDLQISESGIALARNGLKVAQSDVLPTLSLQASNSLARPIPNASPAQDFYINAWGVTLNLSYNLSSWFDHKHNVGSARRQVLLQELSLQQQKQTLRKDVRTAFVKHSEAIDRIAALEESLAQASENYRIMKSKYFNQLTILTDLLDANAVQLDAELQLTSAQVNAIYTYYQLQRASGNL